MNEKMTKTINKALIDNDMTVTILAGHLGLSRSHVSRTINGYYPRPPIDTVKRIAKELHLKLEDLGLNNHKRAA